LSASVWLNWLGQPAGHLKPDLERTLRELGMCGDIIRTMRQVLSATVKPEISNFALHDDEPADPILGRLVPRGVH